MAADGIDESLFNKHPELLPLPLGDVIQNRRKITKTWRKLTRYSLLKKQVTEKRETHYTMHRLLQDVVRNKIKDDQQWMLCCLDIFEKTYDFDYWNSSSIDDFVKLIPHVETFLSNVDTILIEDKQLETMAHLYVKSGYVSFMDIKFQNAFSWFQKALNIHKILSGVEYLDTTDNYVEFARMYEAVRHDYTESKGHKHKDIYKELNLKGHLMASDICEKVLGLEHPITIKIYSAIAKQYKNLKEHNKSVEWYEKVFSCYKKVLLNLDSDSQRAMLIFRDIADISYYCPSYGEHAIYNYNEAIKWYCKALDTCEKVLGAEDSDAIKFREPIYRNMGYMYSEMGYMYSDITNIMSGMSKSKKLDNVKALEYYHKALYCFEKTLFPKSYRNIILACFHIGEIYTKMRDFKKALELYLKASEICESKYGTKNYYTNLIYKHIIKTYEYMGDKDKATEYRHKRVNAF